MQSGGRAEGFADKVILLYKETISFFAAGLSFFYRKNVDERLKWLK